MQNGRPRLEDCTMTTHSTLASANRSTLPEAAHQAQPRRPLALPRGNGALRVVASLGVLSAVGLASAQAEAQTVADLAARGLCSTSGLSGISDQLAEAQMCLRPNAFVSFAPHAGVSLSSSGVRPFLQASARDALWAAAAKTPLTINSAFRTLADQYVLYYSGGCGLAAKPGSSNHQSGRAVDVGNYSAARSALESAGCKWLGSSDPVHFDCPGVDGRADAILAFQRLWNINHPGDLIDEDGDYGPQTEARLANTPAAGFAKGGCEEPPPPVECANGTAPFFWDCAGAIPGLTCTQINEPSDADSWSDNYLCAEQDVGLQWSYAGAIDGMRCIAVTEPADPGPWSDNYLCVPPNSPYVFTWSAAGDPGGDCVRFHEPEDPNTWDDNYLCWTFDDSPGAGGAGSGGAGGGWSSGGAGGGGWPVAGAGGDATGGAGMAGPPTFVHSDSSCSLSAAPGTPNHYLALGAGLLGLSLLRRRRR